jgi:IS30 family transposase
MRERRRLAMLHSMNLPISEIARRLRRHRSTLYRELSRNRDKGYYWPGVAHQKARQRHPRKRLKLKQYPQLRDYVSTHLQCGWSPEQIAGRLRLERQPVSLCHESIYRYIYRYKLTYHRYLTQQKPQRGIRYKQRKQTYYIVSRQLKCRSKEVETRQTFGHWEGDTLRFRKCRRTCVTSLVERKSLLVLLKHNQNAKSETVMNNIKVLLCNTPRKIWQSITFDQGSEFAQSWTVERCSRAKVYYAQPHSPWQRGTNENTNRRLRRYLPRQMQLKQLTQPVLDNIATKMNNTPRKCLGFLTPKEVYANFCKTTCRAAM